MEPKPRPPDTLPQYVIEGVERQGSQTLEDLAEWAIELAEHKRRPPVEEIKEELPDDASVEGYDEETGGWVYTKMIPCGKDRCTSCPHGPYIYKYYYDDSGSLTSEYVGKANE